MSVGTNADTCRELSEVVAELVVSKSELVMARAVIREGFAPPSDGSIPCSVAMLALCHLSFKVDGLCPGVIGKRIASTLSTLSAAFGDFPADVVAGDLPFALAKVRAVDLAIRRRQLFFTIIPCFGA